MCVVANVNSLRQSFASGKTKSIKWRLGQLQRLLDLFKENETAIKEALYKDLRKPGFESDLLEITVVKNEIINAMKSMRKWMKHTYPSKTMAQFLDTVYIQKEPRGVVLIISTWNYPIYLIFNVLVGVLAAGNCALIKPSEISPATADLVAELIPKYMDNECVQVMLGGVPETTEILNQKFDFIAYTGRSSIGKIVMSAASKFLTPVLLELGGKSPVYVDKGCDLNIVANRIIWGKCSNSGQTCIAPDYILCHSSAVESLIEQLKATIIEFYGEFPLKSKCYGKIVNSRHFKRLLDIIEEMPKEKLVFGGGSDVDANSIEPTIFKNVSLDDKIMEDEIFGPLLPIITVNGPLEAIEIINGGDKPLALYIFSKNSTVVDNILNCTSAGGVSVNDTLMHGGVTNLPFGGVGNSGFGNYHGQHSFDTFSHLKPVMKRNQNLEGLVTARYPPYSNRNLSRMKTLVAESERSCACTIL